MAEMVGSPVWVILMFFLWLAVCWGLGAGTVFFAGVGDSDSDEH